jgi:hypothetical protein
VNSNPITKRVAMNRIKRRLESGLRISALFPAIAIIGKKLDLRKA